MAKASFKGSLVAVPTPLPEDDESVPTVTEADASVEAESTAEVTDIIDLRDGNVSHDQPAEMKREINAEAQAPPTSPAPATKPAKAAPSTIRLNDQAGTQLWSAYLEAKAADPFLSYRQFASNVMLDGLKP